MKYEKYWMGLNLIGIITWGSCTGKSDASQQKAPPVLVNVYTVREGSAIYFDVYPATVTALNQVEVRPQVAGYINGIFFKDGQHVYKGEKLYSIDQQQYLAAYNAAVANLNVAKANLAKTQQDADRYEELSKQDAIARQTLDHALADLESSKKQVDAAEANVNEVQTNLRYSTIYAPFSGTIGISAVKLGAAVSPGQTLLNTISSDDPIAVDFEVDQKQIPRFARLQEQRKSSVDDSTFSIIMSDQSKYPYPGYIYLIDRAVDPQTGTIKTRLVFPNPKNYLKAGMTCNVYVRNDIAAQSILIPYKAVTEQMGEDFVFVVGDSNKVSQQKIALGPRVNEKVVVKNGLQSNQEIVIDGMQKLHEGSIVQLPPSQNAGQQDSSGAMNAGDSTKRK